MLDCIHPHENPTYPVFWDLEDSEIPNRYNESLHPIQIGLFVVIIRDDASSIFDRGSWNEILE